MAFDLPTQTTEILAFYNRHALAGIQINLKLHFAERNAHFHMRRTTDGSNLSPGKAAQSKTMTLPVRVLRQASSNVLHRA
jgi:hypothetical protein